MTDDTNQKRYGKNRNVWRKVQGYSRTKPRNITFVDTATSRSLVFDLNKTYRHRDFFVFDKKNLQSTASFLSFGQYEEGLLLFHNESEKTSSFSTVFDGSPIVVYTVESDANFSGNVNVFGLSIPTSSSFSVGVSAPFSGSIRYRALYHTSYPVQVETLSSGTIWVFGGQIDVTGATDYTASYTIPAGVLEYRATSHDAIGNGSNNVDLSKDAFSVTEATNSISAPLTNKIHFIVTST